MAAEKATQPQTFEIDMRNGMPAYVIGVTRQTRMSEGGPISGEPVRHPYVSIEILPDPLRRQVVEAVRVVSSRGPT